MNIGTNRHENDSTLNGCRYSSPFEVQNIIQLRLAGKAWSPESETKF